MSLQWWIISTGRLRGLDWSLTRKGRSVQSRPSLFMLLLLIVDFPEAGVQQEIH